MMRRFSCRHYVDGILRNNRTVLAQAITLMESARPADEMLAGQVLEACLPHTGNSIRVGITGAPGVGKSTLIETLGTYLTRERGETVAVLAVDPSSQVSGGSILGDKTRMENLGNDPRAFIRPSPTGGSLGGVSRRTREVMLLCEAAGYRNVLIETVGVGQSETMVRAIVDFFLLLLLPDSGDELQGIKRGIMELADLIAVNKADGDNRARAEAARKEFSRWQARVITCSARTHEGVPEIWDAVIEHNRQLREGGLLDDLRRRLAEIEREVIEGRVATFRGVDHLLKLHRSEALD